MGVEMVGGWNADVWSSSLSSVSWVSERMRNRTGLLASVNGVCSVVLFLGGSSNVLLSIGDLLRFICGLELFWMVYTVLSMFSIVFVRSRKTLSWRYVELRY